MSKSLASEATCHYLCLFLCVKACPKASQTQGEEKNFTFWSVKQQNLIAKDLQGWEMWLESSLEPMYHSILFQVILEGTFRIYFTRLCLSFLSEWEKIIDS